MSTTVETIYRRWEGTIQILNLIVIPLAIFLVGWKVTSVVENSKTQQEYVRIATGILSAEVKKGDDQKAIRTWAVDVLARYSPVAIAPDQREKLISGAARTPIYGGYNYDSSGYSDYEFNSPKEKKQNSDGSTAPQKPDI